MSTSDLLQRYIFEVGRHLPRRQRKDIQAELYSLLQDSLEESRGSSELTDDKHEDLEDEGKVIGILRELGPPSRFADRYKPQRYLIGPTCYSDFKMVLTIVLSVITGIYLFGIIAAFLLDSDSAVSIVGIVKTFSSYFRHLLVNSGIVILIFVLIERFSGDTYGEKKKEDWEPSSLPEVDDPDRISRGGTVASIAWHLVFAVILVIFPHWIGFISFNEGGMYFTAMLVPEFDPFIPWFASFLIVEAGLYFFVLRAGRWLTGPRWVQLVLNLAWIVLLYLIITGGPITTISILTVFVKIILAIILVISIFEAGGQLYRLVTSPPGAVWRPGEQRPDSNGF